MMYWTDFGFILVPFVAILVPIAVFFWVKRKKVPETNDMTVHQEDSKSAASASDCPICLRNDPSFRVQSNCGHSYCGMCFLQYCKTKGSSGGVSCPYCTQKVTSLYSAFTKDDPWDENLLEMLQGINNYNRESSSTNAVPQSTPACLRLLLRQLTTDFKRHCLSSRQRVLTTHIVLLIGLGCILNSSELLAQIGVSFFPDLFWGTLSVIWYIPSTMLWVFKNWGYFVETLYWTTFAPIVFVCTVINVCVNVYKQQQLLQQQQQQQQQELFAKFLAPDFLLQ